MKLLLILYALCVLFTLAMCIYLFVSGNIKDCRPWYWVALLIAFAPITLVVAIVCVAIEYVKEATSPEHKEQQRWAEERERQEQERKATLALYQQRYYMQRTLVPETCLDVAYSLLQAVMERRYTTLFAPLDHLHLPEDKRLFVEFASHHGSGDRSSLYVANSTYGQDTDSFLTFDYDDREPAPHKERSYQIFHHLRVDDTLMGAWQALLVSQLWHVLPYWWHGAYDKRRYIFTAEQLRQLVAKPRKDSSPITLNPDDYSVAPECVEAGGGTYYFAWCYWSEWGGLIRETHQVTISEGKATILHLDKETLHHYDCGWVM